MFVVSCLLLVVLCSSLLFVVCCLLRDVLRRSLFLVGCLRSVSVVCYL